MQSKKFLVVGKGFLGKEFERNGHDLIKRTDIHEIIDFSQYKGLVNCVGFCETRECERPENTSYLTYLNIDVVTELRDIATSNDIPFIHISTGCLFQPEDPKEKCGEDYPKTSMCAYTASKWLGEMNCDPENDVIIRPRLLFNNEKIHKNFLFRLAYEFIAGVSNRYDCFTSTYDIVKACEAVIDSGNRGVYNLANLHNEYISILSLAKELGIELLPTTIEKIRETNGIRLCNNVMDTSKIEKIYTPRPLLPTMKQYLDDMRNS